MGERVDDDRGAATPSFREFSSSSTATVVIAVDDRRVVASLREWFEDEGHDVRVVEPGTVPEDGELFVVDQGSLRATAPALASRKAETEAFLPCLLVVAGAHADVVASSTETALDVVDEVLETPLRTPAMRRRVESLMRARRAITELQERTAHHQRLVELLPASLFVLDDDGTVTFANATAADLLDVAPGSIVGREFTDVIHPEDRDAVATFVDRPRDASTLKARLTVSATDAGTDTVDADLVDGAGDAPVVAELSTASVGVDDTTQVLVRDVTARDRRVERLRLFERAIHDAGVGITIADARAADDPLVFVNDAFCEITGYERGAVLGRNCRFLQGEGTDEETVATVRAAIDANEPVSVTLRNYREDGTPFWNRLEITPVADDDGTVTHFLGFQRDVTGRRERMRLFEHLHDATEALQEARTRERVAASAVESLREILDLAVAGCWFPDDDDTRLEPVAAVGTDDATAMAPGSPDWAAYADRTSVAEVPVDDHGVDTDTGLVFSLGEHGLLGVADPNQPYTEAIRDAGRAFADHVTVALDRAAREADLAETSADLENTLERIRDGFMALDTEYEVTYANTQAERLLPYSAEELEGANLWELFPDEVGGRFWQQYHDALDEQRPRTFEAHYTEKDIWFEVSAYPSEDGLTLYFRDVTERRERERELERYETIVQTAGDPIYTLDDDGRFTSVNEAFYELTGFDEGEVVGSHASLVLPASDVRACEQVIEQLLSADDESQRTVDITVVTADGDRRACEVAIAVLPQDEFGGTVGVVRDLSELKDNEQRLAVLDRVLRHNLRNNLNVVAGRAGSLTDSDDESVVSVAREIETATQDVLDMAEKARAFQRALEEGDVPPREKDLCDLVVEAVESARGAHADSNLACRFDVEGELPVRANDAIELAVRELVENAVIHNPTDDPWVQVTVLHEDGDAVVVVDDDAPPIPEDETAVLDGTVETPLDHASGLGLWLVQWAASSFGGDLSFDVTDRGNRVSLRIPTTR